MSDLSELIDGIKAKIAQSEQAIEQSAANHHILVGQGGALKAILDMATSVANTAAPTNPITQVLDVVDTVVDGTVAETPQ